MTQILSENRERFLVAIAEQVPADRIAEIHFFNPIRQGGLESGVAVVALTKPVMESSPGATLEPSLDLPAGDAAPRDEPPAPRHTVLTAHYRLTLKGIDRGKWQVTVVEEADAPLITVETVVRGVQRRAGDLDDPERMDGDAIREVLSAVASRAG
ncbi:MAG TPA: hypothetical protein VFO55_10185 [Gemmatimonadaceae bacterium]|nr:hypothetical protein [Gemmatimonadaceae bacterium]